MLPRAAIVALLAAVIFLPLLGAVLAGRAIEEFFRFPPPLEIPGDYPRWSWFACGLVLLPFAATAWSWWRGGSRRSHVAPVPIVEENVAAAPARHEFPIWGWLALAWTASWWVLAWTRWPWFAPLQHYTFFPLWLGFIISVNALVFRATGTCFMQREPRAWVALFGVSAVFWWMFEWLNRFVHNWHYLATEGFGPVAYALHATLCFSTVLPAVAAVSEWLATHARSRARFARGPAWRWIDRRATGIGLLVAGGAALLLTGARPREFYPALWGAPLALAIGAGVLSRRSGVWRELAIGDWRRAATWALAAVICGFFWEMWNVHSAAKWIYTVPFVDRWHLFEMPALGYLGYLPFGLECLVIVDAAVGRPR